ncbi:MAG: acyl-CoA dehydrogenase [Acidisphaera sp.]|nr:acyl-CoA dehydrogenase [Acidisphaera sp.]
MDDTARLLQSTATRLFQDHFPPAALAEAERGTWPAAAWAAVEEAGLHHAMVPEHGVAVPDALALLRVAGEHAVPLPLTETMLATWLLAGAGLPIPDGPLTVASGDVALVREGGGWRLAGLASRVPWGRHAAAVAVLAGGLVALVEKGGWTAEHGANMALEPRDDLRFDVVVDAVAPAGDGGLRAVGAAMRSLQIAGALLRVTAMTTRYAQDRVQFGRPIGKFQAIQQYIATMAAQTAAAVAAADLAAEAVADGVRVLPIAAAKARTGEAASLVAGLAHQVHGAIGFTYEHALHFSTKRLWSWRDEFGSEAEWNAVLGRHIAGAGAVRLWEELTAW